MTIPFNLALLCMLLFVAFGALGVLVWLLEQPAPTRLLLMAGIGFAWMLFVRWLTLCA